MVWGKNSSHLGRVVFYERSIAFCIKQNCMAPEKTQCKDNGIDYEEKDLSGRFLFKIQYSLFLHEFLDLFVQNWPIGDQPL